MIFAPGCVFPFPGHCWRSWRTSGSSPPSFCSSSRSPSQTSRRGRSARTRSAWPWPRPGAGLPKWWNVSTPSSDPLRSVWAGTKTWEIIKLSFSFIEKITFCLDCFILSLRSPCHERRNSIKYLDHLFEGTSLGYRIKQSNFHCFLIWHENLVKILQITLGHNFTPIVTRAWQAQIYRV